ncbi:MAG: hypothetical protein J3Q66DRAFT_76103 [Benniella sp.]|nr:MAG: hypothetical protein J3Q66DRAFT_76103 [Benniella sp.]
MVHHYLTQSAAAKTSLIGHTVHRTLCARQPHTVATVSTVAARRTLHTTPPPAFTVTTSNHTSHQPGRNIAHNTKGIGHTEQTVSTSVCPAAAAARRHLWTQAPIQSKSFSRLQSIHSNCKPFRPLAVNIRGFYSQSEPQELDDVVSFYDDKVSQVCYFEDKVFDMWLFRSSPVPIVLSPPPPQPFCFSGCRFSSGCMCGRLWNAVAKIKMCLKLIQVFCFSSPSPHTHTHTHHLSPFSMRAKRSKR